MKKLWRNYSYAIILVILSLAAVFVISTMRPSSPDNYTKITVKEGESLWQISEKYADQHSLSKIEFVKWVEQHNQISGDHIIAGEKLVIPIENKSAEIQEINNLASK